MMANGMRFSFGCVVEYAVVVARRTSFAICDWSTASCDCFNIASAVLTSCLLCVFSFLYFCSAPGISTFFFGLDDVKWRRGRKTIQQSRCHFFYIDEVHSTKNKKQKHKQGEEYRLCHSSVVCRTGSLSDQKKNPPSKGMTCGHTLQNCMLLLLMLCQCVCYAQATQEYTFPNRTTQLKILGRYESIRHHLKYIKYISNPILSLS